MNALKHYWHSVFSAIRSFLHALKSRQWARGSVSFLEAIKSRLEAIKSRRKVLADSVRNSVRIGIASRLVVAFIAVAVLVMAANLIVEQGVLVERTTQISRTTAAPVVPPPLETHAGVAQPPPAPRVVLERRQVTSDALLSALARYGRAVQDRVKVNTEQSVAEYKSSTAELDQASATFVTQAVSISGKSFGKLTAAINAYKAHADDVVLVADNRRAVLTDYSSSFEGLNARVKASLDGAWTILGRVVARQSLLQLSAQLDGLRRNSVALSSAESEDAPEITPLLSSEHAAERALEADERGFRRSQGDQWYTAMRDDFAHLLAVSQSLPHLNQELGVRNQELIKEAASVAAMSPGKVEAPVIVAAPARRTEVARPTHATGVTPVETQSAAIAPAAPAVETHSVTTQTPEAHSKRILVAWISVGVLVLLICVSLGTILSIVRPVRRLLDATARLAKGDNAIRVSRGGIKELDTLAVAFNAMADQLSSAQAATREYQQGLESKVAERTYQLQELAEHDPLTGLPNRRELFALLNAAIERARAESYLVGVFFLDIDNFKYINDGMGHAFGDRVLVSLAQRLQDTANAFGFAARLGGDEFTIVYERALSVDDIRAAGLRVVQAFQTPLAVDGRELIVSVSVGASIYPDHEQDAEALLRAADAALFRAKALGRSQLSVFTPELIEAASAKFTTEQGLRRAIERGEFELVFQPEVSVETLETTLVEALIRWRMPDGSLAAPGEFLAIAEESGLIMEISDWVLRSAIEAAAHWHHGAWPDARVAVNVSPRQLIDQRFVERLRELLREYRLPARCIEIELTETVLQTGPATIETLKCLRAHGVAIALDDFGTGYSSLASLEQLPLTRIKLDRSLIASIDTSPRSAAIARAIIGLCHGLGLEVTAEGVERPEQFALLLGQRAMYLQGYLLARPVTRDELLPVMADVNRRAEELLLTSQKGAFGTNVVELSPSPVLRAPQVG
jgi:diguanylate cyclase (GGDEF)-like protein